MKAFPLFLNVSSLHTTSLAFFVLLSFTFFLSCSTDDPWKQEQLNLRLLEAAAAGNIEAVDSAIRKGAFLECRTIDGATPLILAASRNQSEVIALLLSNGAQVNNRREGYYRSTALMEAAVNNDTTSAQLLIEAGADIYLRDTFGDPAINWGAYYGHVPYVALLLENGADWNVKSKHGNALDVTIKEWNLELYDFFIAQGFGEKKTVEEVELIAAVKNKERSSVAEILTRGGDPDLSDALGMPILIWAAINGDIDILRLLIDSGAEVNVMNASGQTALAAAARFGYMDVVDILVNNGADVTKAGKRYHLTPMINAAIGGQAEIADILLERGATINDQDVITGLYSFNVCCSVPQ
jgi:ankyrin repeat protein